MISRGERIEVVHPLFQEEGGGSIPTSPLQYSELVGENRRNLQRVLQRNHYTRSVPSGKSHYIVVWRRPFVYEAIIVWSIPANKNIAKMILGFDGNVWELSRLWAPDGHATNLLTEAISVGVAAIKKLESPDALVSYADPSAGHSGGVYKAASWSFHGTSEEVRSYIGPNGTTIARRAFHSGGQHRNKAEIEAMGFKETRLPGKLRFVKILSKRAKANP